MKLKALDQFHISSVSPNSIPAGGVFECSDALAEDLLKKHPGKFERAEPLAKNKAERAPQNKAGSGYHKMTMPQLEQLAKDRKVDLADATKKPDIIAALELHDESNAGS